jgi:hypothetical protein
MFDFERTIIPAARCPREQHGSSPPCRPERQDGRAQRPDARATSPPAAAPPGGRSTPHADPDRRRRGADRHGAGRQPGKCRAPCGGASLDHGRGAGPLRSAASGACAARFQPRGRQQRRGRGARAARALGRACRRSSPAGRRSKRGKQGTSRSASSASPTGSRRCCAASRWRARCWAAGIPGRFPRASNCSPRPMGSFPLRDCGRARPREGEEYRIGAASDGAAKRRPRKAGRKRPTGAP